MVDEIKVSCDCTLIDKDKYVGLAIQPGESLPIMGTIRAGAAAGQPERIVTLVTTSGELFEVRLRLNVVETYSLDRHSVDFGSVDIQERYKSLIHVVGANVVDCEASDRWLSAKAVSKNEIEISALPELLPRGSNIGTVAIRLDDPYRPVTIVSVRAACKSSLRALPSFLFLPSRQRRHVRFVDSDGRFVPISSASCEHPAVLAEIDQGDLFLTYTGSEEIRNIVVIGEDADGRNARVIVTARP